jgi:hypothetical protein
MENDLKTMVELKSFFFNTLYLWTAALDYPLFGFHDILGLFSF